MLALSLLISLALSAVPVFSQENRTAHSNVSDFYIGVNITDMCTPLNASRSDVVFTIPSEEVQKPTMFPEPIPANILIVPTRLEKTYCLELGELMADPKTTSDELNAFVDSWKHIDAPYIFDENRHFSSDSQEQMYDIWGRYFRHLNGSESWAKGSIESLACSTVGISNAIDAACDKLIDKTSKAFPKNANETTIITGKTADPLQITIETLGAATVENAECKKELKSYVDTYKWKSGGNITTGWIYTHDGNVKTKLNWPKRYIVTNSTVGNTDKTSTCVPVEGEQTTVAEDKENTMEKGENKDSDKSPAPVGKQIWLPMLAMSIAAGWVLI